MPEAFTKKRNITLGEGNRYVLCGKANGRRPAPASHAHREKKNSIPEDSHSHADSRDVCAFRDPAEVVLRLY